MRKKNLVFFTLVILGLTSISSAQAFVITFYHGEPTDYCPAAGHFFAINDSTRSNQLCGGYTNDDGSTYDCTYENKTTYPCSTDYWSRVCDDGTCNVENFLGVVSIDSTCKQDTYFYDTCPCGLSVTAGSPIAFGSVSTGTESSNQTLSIKNTGSVRTTQFRVFGINWAGTTNTMPVGQTSVYDTAWNTLTAFPGINIFNGHIDSSETKNITFKVSIPAGQAADTYNQIITFSGSC